MLFIRFYQTKLVLDLASNNRYPSTFLADSSFVRINKASSEYSYIRMSSQSLYLIENNNTLSTTTLEPMNATDDAMYSFKIINLNQRNTRTKRDTGKFRIPRSKEMFIKFDFSFLGLPNEESESSILKKVKIRNADKGLFVRGVPPKLEDIEITDTSSHGIHFRGFFTGEAPIILNRTLISNSGGNAICFELIGDSRELKVLIEECQFENCNQDCLRWNGAGSLNVSKSSFKNFKKSAVYVIVDTGTFNISIATSSFSSSTSESVIRLLLNRVCEGCYFAEILDNKFINLTQLHSLQLFQFHRAFVTIVGNLFDDVACSTLLTNFYGLSYSVSEFLLIFTKT